MAVTVRAATKDDIPAIMDLIMLLAVYEKEQDQVEPQRLRAGQLKLTTMA